MAAGEGAKDAAWIRQMRGSVGSMRSRNSQVTQNSREYQRFEDQMGKFNSIP